MSEARYVTVQYCDDVRQEVGNKFSLMGCYGESMLVPSFPTLLPRLCAQVRVYTPVNRPLSELVIRVYRGEEVISEITAPIVPVDPATLPKWVTRNVVNALMVMSPFPIERACTLRVEAVTEEGAIDGGKFPIDIAPPIAPVEENG